MQERPTKWTLKIVLNAPGAPLEAAIGAGDDSQAQPETRNPANAPRHDAAARLGATAPDSEPTLPGILPDPYRQQPARLRLMIRANGEHPGEKCQTCEHFRRYSQARTWFKCDLTRQSHSAATDWRAHWPACGQWKARGDE